MLSTRIRIPTDPARIERAILLVRGQRVMLDLDLATIYGVTTRRLNEQVRRNRRRFPADFMFQLTLEEFVRLRSHYATANLSMRRTTPCVFTEHGAVVEAIRGLVGESGSSRKRIGFRTGEGGMDR